MRKLLFLLVLLLDATLLAAQSQPCDWVRQQDTISAAYLLYTDPADTAHLVRMARSVDLEHTYLTQSCPGQLTTWRRRDQRFFLRRREVWVVMYVPVGGAVIFVNQ